MDTDSLLQFWHEHLNTIIGVLIAACFVLIAVYLFLEFWKEKNAEEVDKNQVDLGPIEESLKKLLEGAQVPKAAATADSGADPEELQKLQALLDEKDELIQKLEESQNGESAEAGDSKELEEKIKDLEARLMEYEIIEDDIADLSMYKEENVRLKDELEKLKSGGAASAPSPEQTATTSTDENTVGDSAEEKVSQTVAEMTAENPNDEIDLGDDIMAEFAAAVQEQKNGPPPVQKAEVEADEDEGLSEDTGAELDATVSATDEISLDDIMASDTDSEDELSQLADVSSDASVESASQTSSEVGSEENVDDNLVADAMDQLNAVDAESEAAENSVADNDLSEVVQEKEEVSDPMDLMEGVDVDADDEAVAASESSSEDAASDSAVEDLSMDFDVLAPDTDKMLGEIEALNASAAGDDGSDALLEAVDTDKMLNEMDDLNSSVGGGSSKEESEQKQLASEFDNFVKES